jgi:RNA polymerase sigma factor (sigma-70 family)
MPKAPFSDLLQYLRKVCGTDAARDLTDAELMQRFRAQRDEAAFSVLVSRHGPMVLGVCRRLLGDLHGAEDAFQASFLVLVRRAASVSCKPSLAPWLHAVAQRVAIKARTQAVGRRQRERQFALMQTIEPLDDLTWKELRTVLDEEIARLAEKHRSPLVLCYLEGKSYEKAGTELGLAKTTLRRRLDEARELLRERLVRRGVTLSAGALATVLCEKLTAPALGAMLTVNTVKAAVSLAAGKAVAAGCISVEAVALAQRTTVGIGATKLKLVILSVAIGAGVGGAGLAGYSRLGQSDQATKATQKPKVPGNIEKLSQEIKDAHTATDLYGDPLPEGAIARLGTMRFRNGDFAHRIVFSPDGKLLASGAVVAGGVVLFDATNGKLLRRVAKVAGRFAFSPDSKSLFLSGSEPTLVDLASGKELRRFQAPGYALYTEGAAAFSPDGKTVAVGGWVGGNVKKKGLFIWDVATSKVQQTLDSQSDVVIAFAFSPNGKVLAFATLDRKVQFYELATAKELMQLDAGGPTGQIPFAGDLVFSPDGQALALARNDGEVPIWDAQNGKLLHQLNAEVGNQAISFSPDGKLLATGGQTGKILIWDLASGQQVRQWQAQFFGYVSPTFSPSGKVLAAAGAQHTIKLWDPQLGTEIDPIAAHSGQVNFLEFAPDGKTLYSFGSDMRLFDWDLQTSQLAGRLFGGPLKMHGTGWWPESASDLSADAKTLAVVGSNGVRIGAASTMRVFLWDTVSGKEIRLLASDQNHVISVRFAPDGKRLASHEVDGTIRLWEVATGKELCQFEGPQPNLKEMISSYGPPFLRTGSSWRARDANTPPFLMLTENANSTAGKTAPRMWPFRLTACFLRFSVKA